ncbi:MAG: 50S ribosomal protein L2 [Nanoarchaeota archaeon]
MGKRTTQQARGKGSMTFRVRPRAYRYKITYPHLNVNGAAKVIKLFNSSGHTSPLAEIQMINFSLENKEIKFIIPAANGIYEGQEIYIGKRPENVNNQSGDILMLKDIAVGTKVFNVELVPGKGGKLIRTGGNSAIISSNDNNVIELQIKKRKIKLNENCRAVIGVIAGDGRLIKPLVKAGKHFHMMKAVGRKWHRISAVKSNAVDHPFGSGRGKRIKSKIAKRNAPPGAKVGHIRPRKTGRKKI